MCKICINIIIIPTTSPTLKLIYVDADTLNCNTSHITMKSNNYTTLSSQLWIISWNVANIAAIANYYSGLQSSLAVSNGVVTGSGLVLAFNLKEDKYHAKFPLVKNAPSNWQFFHQLLLQYNGAFE